MGSFTAESLLETSPKMAAIVRAIVRRDSSHSVGEDISKSSKYLSPFQVEKFTYMFNVFFDKHGGDGLIQKEDIIELLEMFRTYCGYDKTNPRYLRMADVMGAFYDCMAEHVGKTLQGFSWHLWIP